MLPAWSAAIVHVPALTPVTTLPSTVQMLVLFELKLTARPDVLVALAVVAAPTPSHVGEKLREPML